MVPWLAEGTPFPPVERALRDPNGLVAAGGDLSTIRLIEAYQLGIFPWFNPGDPILWWSPDPRMVLFPDEIKLSRSMRKVLLKHDYEIRVDSAFQEVIWACAINREPGVGTWITPQIISAYTDLFEIGVAHSIETWKSGHLTGGLYGVAIGKMFFGESMFHKESNASKIAFHYLVAQLKRWQFGMIDCQMNTAHLGSLGAREIRRAEFNKILSQLIQRLHPAGAWQLDSDLFAR